MTPRLDYLAVAPKLLQPMLALERAVAGSGLEPGLIHLVKTRASQINGCAFCIEMHTRDALKAGETAARLFLLDAWEEAPHYTPRERAALAWTEAVTRIGETHVPDEAYDEVRAQFSEQEIVALTFALVTINGWNRLAVSFRVPVGTYQPGAATAAGA